MAKGQPFDETLNFYQELEFLATTSEFRKFRFTLVSGERYEVTRKGDFVVYQMMYIFYPPEGGLIMFPFTSVCSAEIYPEPKA